MYDFRVLYSSACQKYRRIYYAFKSPPTVADRDFHLKEYYRKDWPRPGMHSLFVQSLPSGLPEMPEQRKKVRANLIIIGFIYEARFDAELGIEVTDVFFVNCLDIMGSVPKWMINKLANSMPKSFFAQFEKECKRYQKSELLNNN